MERGKKGELPRRRARQGPGERSWGLRAGDQGRSPPQRGRPAGPAGGKDRVAGGGITGLGARRGREVGSGGDAWGKGEVRVRLGPPEAGTADQRPADGEPRDCCHL